MVVQEQTLYAGGVAVLLIATAIAVIAARRDKAEAYSHTKVLPVVLGILAAGYLGMALNLFVTTSPDGQPVYITRYLTYLLTYTFLMSYIGLIAGARLRYRLVPAGAVVGFTVGTVIVQLTTSPLDTAGSLLVIVSLVAVFWTLFGPFTRAVASVSGERQLLFLKLRNLAALIFIMYLLVALTNRAALGLLDAFVGVFTVAYIDLVAHIAFTGLIIHSNDAIESVATKYSSPLATFTNRRP